MSNLVASLVTSKRDHAKIRSFSASPETGLLKQRLPSLHHVDTKGVQSNYNQA